MKVTCTNCSAVYTIADHKVGGRRLRVRCKSCKTAIIIDGRRASTEADRAAAAVGTADDEPTAFMADRDPTWAGAIPPREDALEDDATRVMPDRPPIARLVVAEHEETWLVMLDDGVQPAEMTPERITMAYRAREIDDETYVWAEGQPDWLPLGEAASLVDRIRTALEPTVQAAPQALQRARGGTAHRNEDARVHGGRDLFASIDDEAEPEAAPPEKPRGDRSVQIEKRPRGAAPTGARGESSVLFSLNALKAGYEATDPAPRRRDEQVEEVLGLPARAPVVAEPDEDALWTAQAPLAEPADMAAARASVDPGAARGSVPVLVGTPTASGPPRPGGRRGLRFAAVAIGLAAFAGAAGAVVLVLGGHHDSPTPVAVQTGTLESRPPILDTAAAERPEPAPAREPVADGGPEPPPKPATATKPPREEAPTRARKPRSAEREAEPGARHEPREEAPGDTPGFLKRAAPDEPTEEGHTGDEASEEQPDEPEVGQPVEEEPQEQVEKPPFNKDGARSALASAAASVTACKRPDGPTGRGRVTVTFAPSGRVTTANVSGGEYGGTAVGGCIAGIFRRARVPPFRGDAVTVSKSFDIH